MNRLFAAFHKPVASRKQSCILPKELKLDCSFCNELCFVEMVFIRMTDLNNVITA